jgi:hypothetical protein
MDKDKLTANQRAKLREAAALFGMSESETGKRGIDRPHQWWARLAKAIEAAIGEDWS